ncbi:MAG TPA: hypothetical protein VGJ40_00795 [Gaiellaceae bacterium]|jgi:hypothetical protein
MIPEAPPEQTEEGLVAVGGGWFVLNARDARWWDRPGRRGVSFTGTSEFEADTYFPQLGVNLAVVEPGEANSMYHWETETESTHTRTFRNQSPPAIATAGFRARRGLV